MGRSPLALLGTVLAVVCLTPASAGARRDLVVVRADSAFVTVSDDGDGWTIGNDIIHYDLAIDHQAQSLIMQGIQDMQTGRAWLRSVEPDTWVTINEKKILIGSSTTIFDYFGAYEWWGGVRLDIVYRMPSVPLAITRSYACYPGSAVIESWTTFQATGSRSVTLSNLTAYDFAVPNGELRWVSGTQIKPENGGSFSEQAGDLDDGQTFTLGSDGRVSEQALPFFAVHVDDAEFFGSILWSGSWRFEARRQGDDIHLRLGLPPFGTQLPGGGSLETPHAIFGFTNAGLPSPSLSMRSFVELGLRHGRPFRPLVTYNTWYAFGTFIDEGSLMAEMNLAASMGVELFVVDAGWWSGISLTDSGDFSTAWGNWEQDPERFPSGLGFLSDYAHQLGLRFGVWVEPERVDRRTVGQPGLAQEPFLAMTGLGKQARYDPAVPNAQAANVQICLADPAARAFLIDKLFTFLDNVHPDYLKWDNNFWINCQRPGHGHGNDDGNFAHFRGLAQMLDDIRARYPDLDIENSASGGNRLSLDRLIDTDVAWMDDRTSPASHVRHNLSALGSIFPSAYLSSFLVATETEPIADGPEWDLPYLARSRMPGVLGISFPVSGMDEGMQATVGKQFALYKLIRRLLTEGALVPLTPQVTEFPEAPWSGWDAVELLQTRTGEAVVMAFDTPDAPPSIVLRPKGLWRASLYDVESADYGLLGTVSGADLATQGVEVPASSISRGHVLIFRVHVGDGGG